PDCPLARCWRVHVRPAPAIVRRCPPAPSGPAEAAIATSTSPGLAVLNAAVVRLFRPSEMIILSTAGGATVLTTFTDTGADVAELPAASNAFAVSVCAPSVTA